MTRIYHRAESTSESSIQSDTYQDKVSLSFTPGNSETWLFIATWIARGEDTTTFPSVKLVRTSGVPKDLCVNYFVPHDDTDYWSGGCFAYETFGSSPGSQTYKIQYKNDSAVKTTYIKEAKITAIRLESNDKYTSLTTIDDYTGDTNWNDRLALTFTPDSTGDYLILCSSIFKYSAAFFWKARIDLDGATQYDTTNVNTNGNNFNPWCINKVLNLTNASHTIKLQWATSFAGSTISVGYSYIIALRMSDFDDSSSAESEGRSTTSSSNYQDKVAIIKTLGLADYLVIATAGWDHNNSASSCYVQLIQDVTSLGEQLREPNNATTARHYPFVNSKVVTGTDISSSIKIQYKAENNIAGIQDARMAILELGSSIILPTVITNAVTGITSNLAIGNGEVTSSGGGTILQRGFVWSTSVNPTTADDKVPVAGTTGVFSGSLTGLSRVTTYHVRAFASNEVGTAYGADVQFDTLAELPTVTTSDATSVTSVSAIGHGNVTDSGGSAITERGFVWSLSANPTTADNKLIVSGTTGAFSGSITGLTTGVTYHYRAYATNSVGTAYGADYTISTVLLPPTVITSAVTDIGSSAATANGDVVDAGGGTILERGFAWGTSPNPTVTVDNKVVVSGALGVFTGPLVGLSSSVLYHVRAYAINEAGIAYGADVSFTSLESGMGGGGGAGGAEPVAVGTVYSPDDEAGVVYAVDVTTGNLLLFYKKIDPLPYSPTDSAKWNDGFDLPYTASALALALSAEDDEYDRYRAWIYEFISNSVADSLRNMAINKNVR